MTNPIYLELPDLIQLKKEVENFDIPLTNKLTYSGFGEGKSLFKSRGLNFQEVRQYQPGDDIRQIDWRVTAKYGKPFTKLYEEEKERQVYIFCDLRKPMHFASHGHFKSVVAARLAVLCAFLAEHKNDSLTYQILADKLYSFPSNTCSEVIPQLLNQLINFNSFSNPLFNQIFPFIGQNVHPGALLFFISDFHDATIDDLSYIGQLASKNTITFLHIYDDMEVHMPEGIFPCADGSKILNINSETTTFKKAFKNSWEHRTLILRQIVQKYGLGYLPLRTDSNYINQFKVYCLGE